MEESGDVHSEEKALPETNKKRRFKTPSQVQALEEFYNEHKYPTDSMKAELAEKLGLIERQISGWFCHRRLKDRRLQTEEAQTAGRQDVSNGGLQDQGSGLRQDSCGSTKRGDYKLADLREVESRRLCDEDLPPVEVHYGQTGHYATSEMESMDGTSSESDSDLQDSYHPRGRDLMDVEASQYGMPNGSIPQSRGRAGPSGYLKIKGQIENVAITAVKRQLGRQYQEDGPALGVDFDPLPPDAFESPSRNAVHDRSTPIPLDVRGARFPPSLRSDLYADAAKSKPSHGSNQDTLPHHRPLKTSKNGDAALSQKASYSSDEYSADETSVYDGNMHTSANLKHAVHGKKPDPFPNSRLCASGGKIRGEWSESWQHNYDDMNPKAGHKRSSFELKRPSLKSKYKDSLDKEELVLPSQIIEPEELSGEKRIMKEHQDPVRHKRLVNDMKASKRGRGFVEPDFLARQALQEVPPLTKQIRGSALEMPSSFSEDETALTSSSVD